MSGLHLEDLLTAGRRAAAPRERVRRGWTRFQLVWWMIAQCAVGAAVAWALARHLVQHGSPVFAPIAAVVCLGLSYGARLRRVVELAVGVSIGVGLAGLLVHLIGPGWWQIGLVVMVGMSVAVLLGGGSLITNQAALQGIFLVGLPQPAGGGLARWEDALIGSAVALLVAAALPPDPTRAVRPLAKQLVHELADVVDAATRAARVGDPVLAEATLERARGTHVNVDRLTEALRSGEEITRISPLRRGRRAEMDRYRRTLIGVDRAARNMRVGVRRLVTVLERGRTVPEPIVAALADLSAVLHVLAEQVGTSAVDLPLARASAADPADDTVPGALIELAGRLEPARLGATTMSTTVMVAQLRSAVVDLLAVTGMDRVQARNLLPRPGGPAA